MSRFCYYRLLLTQSQMDFYSCLCPSPFLIIISHSEGSSDIGQSPVEIGFGLVKFTYLLVQISSHSDNFIDL
jgi:hypothetical protein